MQLPPHSAIPCSSPIAARRWARGVSCVSSSTQLAKITVARAPLAWDAAGRDLRRSPRAQNPLAGPILGLGLALLTLAGVLLGRAGQGIT